MAAAPGQGTGTDYPNRRPARGALLTMTTKTKKAGGRPPLPPLQRQSARFEFRLTQAQREKLVRLGGTAWLHRMIDEAPEPRQAGS